MRIPVLEPDLLDEASLAEKEAAQNAAALSTLWQAYKDTGDRSKRDRLIVHYAPLVKYVAGRVRSGLPNNVEAADLVSYGMFGLIDAIDKFDISQIGRAHV